MCEHRVHRDAVQVVTKVLVNGDLRGNNHMHDLQMAHLAVEANAELGVKSFSHVSSAKHADGVCVRVFSWCVGVFVGVCGCCVVQQAVRHDS